ncbi:NAD(P)/FAD-dependent oxidoreductase [Emticicia agri]|uniref:NAD(P)/FAD-dependent oxidoreductase n=1 Tax=Emticicia agri TaxID=2492393 RepID=A0A4Q5M027_9BACT|nr:NAD(P)/FAD-dependent oxidoreductase [Emticicia agri]
MENLIIGAGPSGLSVAGRLRKAGIPFEILEKTDSVGSAWRNHYDRLHLHTDKKYSALPHLPFPKDYPTFIPKNQYIAYIDQYADYFNIKPIFNQEVTAVRKSGDLWVVKTKDKVYEAKNVLIATGYNRVPKYPTLKGQGNFKGEIIHSEKYKNGKPYKNKNVLVVGYGNSGAEIALDLYESGAKAFVSIRNPVNIVKREFKGRSTQSLAIFFIRFGNTVYDFIARLFKKLVLKAVEGTGIPISPLAPSEQLRTLGKVAVIDVGTLAQIKAGNITVMPDIEILTDHEVIFKNGKKLPVDAIVMATGYHARLEEIVTDIAPILNERGYPKAMWFNEESYSGLYFVGFNLPLTGILRDINLSSEKIVSHILKGK